MNWDSVMDSSVSRNMRFLNRRMTCPSRVLPFLHRQCLVMAELPVMDMYSTLMTLQPG